MALLCCHDREVASKGVKQGDVISPRTVVTFMSVGQNAASFRSYYWVVGSDRRAGSWTGHRIELVWL